MVKRDWSSCVLVLIIINQPYDLINNNCSRKPLKYCLNFILDIEYYNNSDYKKFLFPLKSTPALSDALFVRYSLKNSQIVNQIYNYCIYGKWRHLHKVFDGRRKQQGFSDLARAIIRTWKRWLMNGISHNT